MKSFFFIGCLFFTSQLVSQKNTRILPSPTVCIEENAKLYLDNPITVDFSKITSNLKEQLDILGSTFHKLEFINTLQNPIIKFNKLKNVIQDSYTITVNQDIKISYSSDQSCFYAMQSLMQMIEKENENYYLQKTFVSDFPKYQWRGLHLDVSRHFFKVEELKKFIDMMAMYKFNTFHWHLTDDQGWRVEIKKYPKLTEIGAWRDSTIENHYTSTPRTYKKERYGGFYTQEQIKEIVRYAGEKYITIVPEIEMPGHSRAALSAYPEFSCNGKQQEVPGLWGVFDDILCAKEESILFMQAILEEIIPLFPGEYVHIGGDEAPKTRWKACQKCQNVIQENNLKDEHELQSYFLQRMDSYLTQKGKKIIGWDEILEGGLSKNAAVMSWRGFDGGLEAAKQEHYVVMTPGSHCYFDHYQGKGKEEPLAIGGFTPLEKVYDFSPIPKGMKTEHAAYVLGGQANLWTEYIPNFDKLMYMAYPRAIALSQTLWCTEKPSLEEFSTILHNKHFSLLEKQDINFSKTSLLPVLKFIRSPKGLKFSIESKNETEQFLVESKINDRKDEFILNPKQIINFQRADKNNFKNSVIVKSKTTGLSTQFIINNSPSLGIPLKFITQPSPSYNSGDLSLVDGQYGSRPWKGHEWIGFDTSYIEIEIDLLKTQKIKTLELSFLQDDNSWIHLPIEFKVESSNRNKSFFSSVKSKGEEKIQIPFSHKVQKIKIKIYSMTNIPNGMPGEGSQPWTFIDEISIQK
jgi:hexosaminidase